MSIFLELKTFFKELYKFLIGVFYVLFLRFENHKGNIVNHLYKKRGKMAQRLTHSGMAALAALSIIISPSIASEFPGRSVNPWSISSPSSSVLSSSTDSLKTSTFISDQRDKIIEYAVSEGDTVSSIASKFGISTDTIRWQNNLASPDAIKVGQVLEILPITGISRKVQKGDSVNSIAKLYDASAQAIVDYPFNSFVNDETFELAIGQTVIVPGGVRPEEKLWSPLASTRRQITPDAGTVVASGSFVWPTSGVITQSFSWYHPGIDIANAASPNILAVDAGHVLSAGWDNTGYGYKVIIDHGNGYRTLYAHFQRVYVTSGQTVGRGDAIGQMGSTGRSTGTHLHFEVYASGVRINPLGVLR